MWTSWLLLQCFLFLSFRPFTWCWPRVLVYFFSFSYLRWRDPYTSIVIPSSLNSTRSPMSIASSLLILPFLSLFSFFPLESLQDVDQRPSCHMQHSQYATTMCATTKFVLFAICKCLTNIFLYLYMLYIIGERKLPFSHIFKEQESKLNYKSSENLSNLITHLHIKPTSEY